MVTLKSNKEEVHKFSYFYRSQFAAYDRKTRPSKISPVRRVEPRISLLEYTMPAASDGLFEEDRVF